MDDIKIEKILDKRLESLEKAEKSLEEITMNDLSTNKNWLRLTRMSLGHLKQAVIELKKSNLPRTKKATANLRHKT